MALMQVKNRHLLFQSPFLTKFPRFTVAGAHLRVCFTRGLNNGGGGADDETWRFNFGDR